MNQASLDASIDKQPEAVAADCRTIMKLMNKATGEEPKMWGATIVGYGVMRTRVRAAAQVNG